MANRDEDSDGFDFDDDDDITESNATTSQFESSASQSHSLSAKKGRGFEGGGSLMSANKSAAFNVDEIIKTLLTNKVRNIGLTGEISETNIIELIDRAKDIFT